MPATPEQLFAFLDQLGIEHATVRHRPLFTVDDGRDLHDAIPGLHCKSLFLRNKKKDIWLVVMPGDKRANLARIEERLGSGRLSFGNAELLMEVLGVTPGAVTPFALMNDAARRVTAVLDTDMMQSDMVNFHPLRNDASTTIRAEALKTFIEALHRAPVMVNCG